MIFHILSGQMTTLFLSMGLLTTLTFNNPIESFLYGGSKEDVFFKVTNNSKTLAIKPNQKKRFSNLLVVTKKDRYYFNIDYDEKSPHQFVEVRRGVKNHALQEKLSTEKFQVLEGNSSLLFINKKDGPIQVNGKDVKRRHYFSKGVPILVEGERVLN